MKDCNQQTLESFRPSISAYEAVSFCLEQLYKDKRKKTSDYVCKDCTYEELIGALLLARDATGEHEDDDD